MQTNLLPLAVPAKVLIHAGYDKGAAGVKFATSGFRRLRIQVYHYDAKGAQM